MINLNNATINCESAPGINVLSNNKVTINISGTNSLSSKTILYLLIQVMIVFTPMVIIILMVEK